MGFSLWRIVGMLKDAIFEEISPEAYALMKSEGYTKSMVDDMFKPKSWMMGIYTLGYLNMGSRIENLLSDSPIGDDRDKAYKAGVAQSDYGVADNIQQVLNYYDKQIKDSNRKYCISCTGIRKSDQPENGGWRWCKWGEYIGIKNSQADYLYDEPVITEVLVFQIYELK